MMISGGIAASVAGVWAVSYSLKSLVFLRTDLTSL